MRIVTCSDTHTKHNLITIPPCDVLIHAGDFSWKGRFNEVLDFAIWLREQPAKRIIVIAGNHEVTLDRRHPAHRMMPDVRENAGIVHDPFGKITYLEDNAVTIDGVKFYGTPYTPWFHDWGFNGLESNTHPFSNYGELPELKRIYGHIHDDTDVLICHGPCYGCVDQGGFGNSDERLGSMDLLKRTQELKNLKLIIGGHIHEARGVITLEGKVYANVATLDRDYETARPPVLFDLVDGDVTIVSGYEKS